MIMARQWPPAGPRPMFALLALQMSCEASLPGAFDAAAGKAVPKVM